MFLQRILPLLSFLLILFQSQSQNLVPNPSFENTRHLLCNYVAYSYEFDNAIYDWSMPTAGTSDMLSSLASRACALSAFSLISNTSGNQMPRTGTTMTGLVVFGPAGQPNYREYLQVQLTAPLIIGKTYYAEMYVSSGDAMQNYVNNIGMYFSPTSVANPRINTTLLYTSQVKSTTIISDTVNWIKISGTFTATTAARYLTIGNFNDDASTASQLKGGNKLFGGAYYFFDDISVEPTCVPKTSSITICKGNSTTLSASANDIVSWALASSPNTILASTPDLTVSPQVTTNYIGTHACGQTSTFEVVVHSAPEYTLGNDTTLCFGQTISFDATIPNTANYLWQDGSTNPAYKIKDLGYYTVVITNDCGTLTDDIYVTPCCIEGALPNLITPNGDGKNDTFNIGCLGNGDYELVIYNRWGSVIYQSSAYLNNWSGDNISDGVYYYAIKDKAKTLYRDCVQVLR